MSEYPTAGTLNGQQAAVTNKDERKETVTATIASTVKTELSFQYDTFKESYVTSLAVKNEDQGDGLWKEAHSGLSANRDNLASPAYAEQQQIKLMDGRDTIKSEEVDIDGNQHDALRPSGPTSTAVPKKEEEVQSMNVEDTHAFLNFETMEDKKVKYEQQGEASYTSRAGSSEASTSSLKDESEEPETITRKPGLPVSIAHLPVANKEVNIRYLPINRCVECAENLRSLGTRYLR